MTTTDLTFTALPISYEIAQKLVFALHARAGNRKLIFLTLCIKHTLWKCVVLHSGTEVHPTARPLSFDTIILSGRGNEMRLVIALSRFL